MLLHIRWLVSIAVTPLIGSLPVGIPKGTGTCGIKGTHASVVIPRKVGRAAGIEGRVHI